MTENEELLKQIEEFKKDFAILEERYAQKTEAVKTMGRNLDNLQNESNALKFTIEKMKKENPDISEDNLDMNSKNINLASLIDNLRTIAEDLERSPYFLN